MTNTKPDLGKECIEYTDFKASYYINLTTNKSAFTEKMS